MKDSRSDRPLLREPRTGLGRACLVWVIGLGALLAPQRAWCEEYTDTHPPAGVVLREPSGARAFEASVRGKLLDWAALDRADGSRRIYLLATTEDDPHDRRSLFRVELEPPRLVTLAADLPKAFDRLRAVAGSDGAPPELLLGRPGQLFRAVGVEGASIELDHLAAAPGLDLGADIPRRGGNPREPILLLPSAGVLRTLLPGSNGDWVLAATTPLVARAERHAYGLRLKSPPTTLLELPAGRVLAVGPEAVGKHRLRTLFLDGADGETTEFWSRLPGAEQVQGSWLYRLDDRPLLIVTTNSADKLGIFERQRLRVFTLYGDRTQAGVGPWLTSETTSRRWQPVEPFVSDVDGDGDDDVVVAQLDGLGGGEMLLEAFINSGDRSFERRSRQTKIDLPAGDWNFGPDLTGDGLPDFVLLTEGRIEVYPTLEPGQRRLVERHPRWSFPGADIPRPDRSVTLSDGGVAVSDGRPILSARPQPVDLDGDGRPELVMADNPSWGFGRLRILFLPAP